MSTTANQKRSGLLALACLLAVMILGLVPAPARADSFANETFAREYAAHPDLWGAPGPVLTEQYYTKQSDRRQVQYFDKGRMELTYPDQQPASAGNGKPVTEMVTGRLQVSDTDYRQYDGAEIPVAGGATFASNPRAPSYRAFQSLLRPTPGRVGSPVEAVLNEPEDEGFFLGIYLLGSDKALGSLAKYAAYIPETGHNIPDLFWSYLNRTDGNGLPAFNWQTLFGLPLTDAYWAKVRDGDRVSDILVQLFERRTLLYNPAAPPGAQVEPGNAGRDYYRWRYEQPELPVVDTATNPPGTSANASVSPEIGEAGTTFRLEARGFLPDERVDFYARVQPDGGVYSLPPLQAGPDGVIRRLGRSLPLETPTQEQYYVLTGQQSGVTALWHLKVLGSIRYTPAVEAAQPDTVPEGINAVLDRPVFRVGEKAPLFAQGFQPNEPLRGWITTPLNRVVGYTGLAGVLSGPVSLQAGEKGTIRILLPAPGTAEPGIYAFTLYGLNSKNSAIVYFRIKTGFLPDYNPAWGVYDPDPGSYRPKGEAGRPPDVLNLANQRARYRQAPYSLRLDD